MTTVAGKAYYGTQLGTIRINGRERSLADFHNLVGFVPQEDVRICLLLRFSLAVLLTQNTTCCARSCRQRRS